MSDQTNYLQQLVNILQAQGANVSTHAQSVLQNAQSALAKQTATATPKATPVPKE